MVVKEILEIYEIIDQPKINIDSLVKLFKKYKVFIKVTFVNEKGLTKPPIGGGETHFLKIIIPGIKGKFNNGEKPTLGIIGQLGGVGARPNQIGFVSDGDGALSVLAMALKLSKMRYVGDILEGDVIITTHLSSTSPVAPHNPVPFMGSPVSLETMNKYNVDKQMDAILVVDTTRGNRIIKNNVFSITPTVKEGWILKPSDDLLTLMEWVTHEDPSVVPIVMQDITPYGNGVSHINSIMQPATVTTAPVVGVAVTSKKIIPGIASFVSSLDQLDKVCRFLIVVADQFTRGDLKFYDENEFAKLKKIYGSMKHLLKK
jgi:hypothetical protein